MDFASRYNDVILKKIIAKIQKDKKAKARAELVEMETAKTGAGVRTSRHWKAAATIEFYYKEILDEYMDDSGAEKGAKR